MSKVRCQFQCQSKKSWFQNVKESISKISIPRSSNGQLQCRACWWFIVLQLWSDLPGFFKTIFLRKSLRDWSILQIYHNFDWSHMIALKRCCAFMVSVLQWQRTTRPPVVQSTTTVWTAATALTTSPSASWSAGKAAWSDTVTFGNLLRWAKAQTNFIASYIHLDAHCLASSDELEPLEIYIHTQSVTSSG